MGLFGAVLLTPLEFSTAPDCSTVLRKQVFTAVEKEALVSGAGGTRETRWVDI